MKIFLLLSLLSISTVQAQFIKTTTTAFTGTVDAECRNPSGLLIAKGSYTGTLGSTGLSGTDLGSGTRLIWIPSLAAFRAGGVDGTQWDDSTSQNIGIYSAAFGFDTTAKGSYSLAVGRAGSAFGSYSSSVGFSGTANGTYSTSWGSLNTGNGDGSLATGSSTYAGGSYSASFGLFSMSQAYASFAIGQYNLYNSSIAGSGLTAASTTAWSTGATDPIFEIGNGVTTPLTAQDAFIVYQNGSATVQGVLTAPVVYVTLSSVATTDVSMFGN